MATTSPMTKRLVRGAILLLALAFAGLVIYRSLAIPTYECEVCIEFRGRTVCRTVQAATTAEARAGAITNACALVSSGVTDTLACERTPPKKLHCRGFE